MGERINRILGAALAAAAAAVALAACGGSGNGSSASGAGGEIPTSYDAGQNWMPSIAKSKSILWAVGDAADGGPTSRKVASMVLSHHPDVLLYLGDVYDSGTAQEFARNYRPIYGSFGARTAPTIGNHEWPNIATGYLPYWRATRGSPPPQWYAFAASGWQLISLNSNTPASGPQGDWLKSLLADTPHYGNCRIAFMHHPRYTSGPHGDLSALQGLFDELKGHAAIALAGHDHDMQRFHPVDGITQYVDGAGGNELYPVNSSDQRLAFFDDTDHGALRVALRQDQAVLTFVNEAGAKLDRSSVACHHE